MSWGTLLPSDLIADTLTVLSLSIIPSPIDLAGGSNGGRNGGRCFIMGDVDSYFHLQWETLVLYTA